MRTTEIINQNMLFISQALLLFTLRYLCDERVCVLFTLTNPAVCNIDFQKIIIFKNYSL